jgi:broad specificity phosphatase PhoE
MSSLFLVRHGQASLGAANYDQLSAIGERQCELLGAHFAARGIAFDVAYTGSLVRHAQSLAAIQRGMGTDMVAQVWRGLNEYQPEAVIRAVSPGPLVPPSSPEAIRHHFRLLRQGLLAWMQGEAQPEGHPPYREFQAGVLAALEAAGAQPRPQRVLVVSSGGPISSAVGHLLHAAPAGIVELNLRLRNSAVCELVPSARGWSLLSFNNLSHLEAPGLETLQTYA